MAVQRQEKDTSTSPAVNGDEAFLVGIAPHFWAHVPMFIDDISNHLELSEGGINFLMPHRIAVSQCLVVGRIVYAQTRSDLSSLYVIDDGTGLIDCVSYSLVDDGYTLPSILPSSGKQESTDFGIGSLVRIFAKIKNLAMNDSRVIRELQIKTIQNLRETYNSNPEVEHWIACAKFQASSIDAMRRPQGCLEELGSIIQSQVLAKRHLPSADDTCGAWRVFGASCQCTCVTIKKSLLYCHCQAKVLPKDPNFLFRDGLLGHLLNMQERHAKKLVFGYKDLKENAHLQDLAAQQLKAGNTTTRSRLLQDNLLRSTVRALAQDGILHHLDETTDQYLLISRDLVLEPYVRDEIRVTGNTKNFISMQHCPPHLSHVDPERLLYIKRCILEVNKKKR